MKQVWAARSGDRIRVQTEPFTLPGWEHRSGRVPDALLDEWHRAGGGRGQELGMWQHLTPDPPA